MTRGEAPRGFSFDGDQHFQRLARFVRRDVFDGGAPDLAHGAYCTPIARARDRGATSI
jgi:hypothetical protein